MINFFQEEDLNNPVEESRRKYALESKLKKVMKALQGESRARKGKLSYSFCSLKSTHLNFSEILMKKTNFKNLFENSLPFSQRLVVIYSL